MNPVAPELHKFELIRSENDIQHDLVLENDDEHITNTLSNNEIAFAREKRFIRKLLLSVKRIASAKYSQGA